MAVNFGPSTIEHATHKDSLVEIVKTPSINLGSFDKMLEIYKSEELSALACCVPASAEYMCAKFGDRAPEIMRQLVGILRGEVQNFGEVRIAEVKVVTDSTDANGSLLVYPEIHFIHQDLHQIDECSMSIAGLTSINIDVINVTTDDYVGDLFNRVLLQTKGVIDTIRE